MKRKKSHGQVRLSQLVTTFGPGSLLDLPHHSVLVGGLDHWLQKGKQIVEPRLLTKLQSLLQIPSLQLFAPPPAEEDEMAPPSGITVWQFPEWFITQDVDDDPGGASFRSRLLVPRRALERGKYVDQDRKKRPVTPVRFIRACRRGHIGDIDWYDFIHGGPTECRRGPLRMIERGTSGDLSEIYVQCPCGHERSLYEASLTEVHALGACDGGRPWLGPNAAERCGEYSRLLVRTASNAYFPQIMSVISLPDPDEALERAVRSVLDFLEAAESPADVGHERKKSKVKAALEGFSDDEVFGMLQSLRGAAPAGDGRTVKQAEIAVLAAAREESGVDQLHAVFHSQALPASVWSSPWMEAVDRVVLIHRLREVAALVGFTRFEVAGPNTEGELEMQVQRAPLAKETTWLPAIENNGEGVFLQFKPDRLAAWAEREQVRRRGQLLLSGFEQWKKEHRGTKREFPGVPYIMLHSLSHLLITAIALECGYPASSIRERIYAGEGGFGILLYTGSPDAEGTLGGLVEVGRRIHLHLQTALDLGKLCSNDPVCGQHDPQNLLERRFLQGAACHGCLLIAETSCEQVNDFLDRALVVPTIGGGGAAFFAEEDK